mgnify:CR=1 FL=1
MEYTGEQLILGAPAAAGRTQKEHVARYRFAQKYTKNKKVLDIACGTGYGSNMLKEAGATEVHGMDVSEEAISFANKNYAGPSTSFSICNAELLNSSDTYDLIVSFETIEHVDDYLRTLKNFYRALKDNGQLIISTPNRLVTSPQAKLITDKPGNPFHVREFTYPEIENAIKDAGFKVSNQGQFGQCKPKKFNNKYIQGIYKLLMKGNNKYSPEVKLINDLPSIKYIVIIADK